MNAKLPILIVAGLFFATISKAQYGGAYVNAQVVIPGQAVVDYGYSNYHDHDRYVDRSDRREGDYEDRNKGRRNWREDEYERYCREHREYRGCRNDFYRGYYEYRPAPYCAPKRVIVYGY